MVGDVAAAVGLDQVGAHARRVDEHVAQIGARAERVDVRVLEQQQVVVARGEQPVLQRQRVAVAHRAEPAHP